MKAVRQGLAKRDETADYCKKRGKIESDTDLRDYERIPFSHKVDEYNRIILNLLKKKKKISQLILKMKLNHMSQKPG